VRAGGSLHGAREAIESASWASPRRWALGRTHFKNAARRARTGRLVVHGVQERCLSAHVKHPAPLVAPRIAGSATRHGDRANEFTAHQLTGSNIHGGTGALEHHPGQVEVALFRFSKESTPERFNSAVKKALERRTRLRPIDRRGKPSSPSAAASSPRSRNATHGKARAGSVTPEVTAPAAPGAAYMTYARRWPSRAGNRSPTGTKRGDGDSSETSRCRPCTARHSRT